MKSARFEVCETQNGQWWWRRRAQNGKIVADGSEVYANKANCRRGLAAFLRGMGWRLCDLIVVEIPK